MRCTTYRYAQVTNVNRFVRVCRILQNFVYISSHISNTYLNVHLPKLYEHEVRTVFRIALFTGYSCLVKSVTWNAELIPDTTGISRHDTKDVHIHQAVRCASSIYQFCACVQLSMLYLVITSGRSRRGVKKGGWPPPFDIQKHFTVNYF